MKDNQPMTGNMDMSSNEPHITLDCPLCQQSWMKKVELNKRLLTSCTCAVSYIMCDDGHGGVDIEMTLTDEQARRYKNL